VEGEEFPEVLARWIEADGDLLGALVALRRLGPEGADALKEALAVRRIVKLRFSWQLWEALVEGDGEDSEAVLLGAIPLTVLEETRAALWGPGGDEPRDRGALVALR
jgi:hypothetical protein